MCGFRVNISYSIEDSTPSLLRSGLSVIFGERCGWFMGTALAVLQRSRAAGGSPGMQQRSPPPCPVSPPQTQFQLKKCRNHRASGAGSLLIPSGPTCRFLPTGEAGGSRRVSLWASATPPTPNVLPPGWGDHPAPPAWHLQASPLVLVDFTYPK